MCESIDCEEHSHHCVIPTSQVSCPDSTVASVTTAY